MQLAFSSVLSLLELRGGRDRISLKLYFLSYILVALQYMKPLQHRVPQMCGLRIILFLAL